MKVWQDVDPPDEALTRFVATEQDLPIPVARLLVSRGYTDPVAADRFLNPRLSDVSDPFLLPGMHDAVDRIRQAAASRDRIVVFGDYDADGVCSTALLVSVLRRMGHDVMPCLPRRAEEGYGLTTGALERCVRELGPSLIITADCGSNDTDAVAAAMSDGIDVIVTDHHEIGSSPSLPLVMINPKLADDANTRDLAGVGVVFKLCHALVKREREDGGLHDPIDLRDYLEWVAIGTVADVVPLTAENRIFARHGIDRMVAPRSMGVRALLEVAGVKGAPDSYNVSFMLAPRINAAGRLGDAALALELLMTADQRRADDIARKLDDANRERQATEKTIVRQATMEIDTFYDDSVFGIVVGRKGWHPGVVGIVASRIVSKYTRPSVVIAFDEDGTGKGSCRSIPGLDILAALEKCSDHLESYGGHAMAAGVTVTEAGFAEFKSRFMSVCSEALEGVDLRPVQRVDAWTNLQEMDDRLYEDIRRMRPFGQGNPRPVWASADTAVVGKPRILKDTHVKMLVACGGTQLDAIAFGMANEPVPDGPMDIAYTLDKNEFRGRKSLQLMVKDYRPARPIR